MFFGLSLLNYAHAAIDSPEGRMENAAGSEVRDGRILL
jgi:hypothetical protein